jgi:beta-lactamase superfamily II metal-dependent hydrolase
MAQISDAPIRILKAAHHGSASSSSKTFLDALRPRAVIISCGRGNLFGHPHPAVLARYRAAGAAIYRTDQQGAITIETDGRTVQVTPFVRTVVEGAALRLPDLIEPWLRAMWFGPGL